MPKLKNLKHETFCQEYASTLNATESYKRVYGASQRVAEVNGSKLLSNTKLQQRFKELMELRLKRIEEEGDEFLNQLRYSALFDPLEMFEFNNDRVTFKEFKEMPIQARRMVDGIKVKRIFSKEGDHIGDDIDIKFVSKAKMKELWGRHAGSFERDNKQKSDSLADLIIATMENKKE